jgi:hypothetical protein
MADEPRVMEVVLVVRVREGEVVSGGGGVTTVPPLVVQERPS